MAQADLITGVSDDLCKVAIRKTDHLNNIELIPIGTDLELFMPGLDIQPLRQKLNIPNAAYVVLSPRQMTPLYNQETIIQSIPKVLQEVPNAVFILKDTFCNTDERKANGRTASIL
jgi:glycosyltransferase involved in cell wall biosynthesis